jgi:YjbE family integral membrane protein
MDYFSNAWWLALASIILIDLILAGDNAIVIAMAAKNLPPHLQRKAIVWGTAGAIAIRSLMTIVALWLLQIPGLMLIGGLALVWIAWQLLADDGKEKKHGPAATTLRGALTTIVIADAVMGIDNVLAVAGASKGSMDLVILGLLISVPIVVFGSQLVLRLIERFPIVIYLGAAVLALTGAGMIANEVWLSSIFGSSAQYARLAEWALSIAAVVIVWVSGWWSKRRASQE